MKKVKHWRRAEAKCTLDIGNQLTYQLMYEECKTFVSHVTWWNISVLTTLRSQPRQFKPGTGHLQWLTIHVRALFSPFSTDVLLHNRYTWHYYSEKQTCERRDLEVWWPCPRFINKMYSAKQTKNAEFTGQRHANIRMLAVKYHSVSSVSIFWQ